MCNDSAGKILKMTRQQLLGHSIAQFFPPEPLNTVFQSHEVLNHLMCSFGGEQYIASIIPILSKGELSNVMINLDNVRTIQRQEQHIRNALAQKGFVAKHRFDAFESRNPSFHTLVSTAKKFAKSEDCVIILGETGTGKEVLAQSIHNHSARANNPFVAVNCSAISETLLESELFGYDEGAFTGARKGGKQGYFEVAHKGTIFLDEIGELSLPLQSKLLRVIQERQLIHVGGSKVINFDVRIIAATNRNLWELVQQQKFREDLYYRLAVLELELPPLRQRQEDILPLFLEFVAKRSGSLAAQLEEKDATLAHLLCSHSWPGNIRELENFAKTVMTMWGDGDANGTFLDLIGTEIQRRKARSVHTALPHPEPEAVPAQTAEWKRIQGALVEAGGNYTRAAAILGISRVTLWRRLKAMEQTAGTDR